jgi:hypothetical protein
MRADDGQGNCPKHVEFYSKNKYKKLVHLVGFFIRIHFYILVGKGIVLFSVPLRKGRQI